MSKKETLYQIIMRKLLFKIIFSLAIFVTPSANADIVTSRSSVSNVVTEEAQKIMRFSYFLSPQEIVSSVDVSVDGNPLLAPKIDAFGDHGETAAVLFLVDVTFSENTVRKNEIKASKDIILELLKKSDKGIHKIGVYPFGLDLDKEFAPFGTEPKKIATQIATLKADEKATAFFKCVHEAQGILAKQDATRKILVILSDCVSSNDEANINYGQLIRDASEKGGFICDTIVLSVSSKTEPIGSVLAQASNGDFIKVKSSRDANLKGNSKLKAYCESFWPRVNSGGSVMVDLTGRENAEVLTFKVNIKSEDSEEKSYEYIYKMDDSSTPNTPDEEVTPNPDEPAVPGSDEGTAPNVEVDPDSPETGDGADSANVDPESGSAEVAEKEEESKMWLWIVLAAGALALGLLIWLLAARSKSKAAAEEEFEYDAYTADPEGDTPQTLIDGQDEQTIIRDKGSQSKYPNSFDMGNGSAYCNTLPENDDDVSAVLLFGAGGAKGIFPISSTAVRLGRGKDNDLSFDNDSASRHHAEILHKRTGEYLITDLDSGNGVYVNGDKITQSELRNNDTVEVGEISFVFQLR